METETTGRVIVEATIEHSGDLWDVERGRLTSDQVRRLVVADALVDTGATLLSLPTSMIQRLGLTKRSTRRVTSSTGVVDVALFGPVQLTIQGRDCTMDVVEFPDSVPVLIGQVPLDLLDFVVDPRNRRLIGNPAHGGERMYEMFYNDAIEG